MLVAHTTALILLGRIKFSIGPSVRVRGTVLREVEDRVYSKKSVIFDIICNLGLVVVSALSLVSTAREKPNVPVRVLEVGCMVQYLIHVVLVWFEYRRVARRQRRDLYFETADDASFAQRCDFFNMMASFVWGIVGVYWVLSGGKLLKQNAPRLYMSTLCDLMIEAFFLSMIMCCILLCIVATRYTVPEQDLKQKDVPEPSLNVLPKYRFHMSSNGEKPGVGAGVMVPPMDIDDGDSATECAILPEDAEGVLPKHRFHMSSNGEKPTVGAGVMVPMDTDNGDSATECVLLPEDAECAIGLCSCDDGIELPALPCNMHSAVAQH